MTSKVKKVSKKKILFVQLDEEITSIFERSEQVPYKEIYYVVPRRAILLQSIVNLRILKQKLEDIDKTMALITNDANGMKLAHQCEIKVFDHWDGLSEEAPIEKKEGQTLLKPVTATQNDIDDDLPSRLPKKKSSIFEVVRGLRGKENGFSLRQYMQDLRKNRLDELRLPGGGAKFTAGLILSGLAVFVFVAYVVLPGATLTIEPASDVVTKAVNVQLMPSPAGARQLKAYAIESKVELTMTHPATGILSEGSRAGGEITIINTEARKWDLVEETRFQTDSGLVFRIQQDVSVPSANGDVPGTITARVLADDVDANGVTIGERGNIEATSFFLPGLREDSRTEIYAESYESFSGGESNVSAIVLEEDLLAAREKLEEQLREKALSGLRKEVLSTASSNGVILELLEDSDVLEYGNAIIDMPYELISQEMEEFEVKGTMEITGVAYDAEHLLAILKTEITAAETPGKELVRIDEESISINVIEFDNRYDKYKFTAQIQGVEEFIIDDALEEGSDLVKRIKEHIAGKDVDDAAQFVQNLPEVNSVEIKIWPVWSPSIPNLDDNIRIRRN